MADKLPKHPMNMQTRITPNQGALMRKLIKNTRKFRKLFLCRDFKLRSVIIYQLGFEGRAGLRPSHIRHVLDLMMSFLTHTFLHGYDAKDYLRTDQQEAINFMTVTRALSATIATSTTTHDDSISHRRLFKADFVLSLHLRLARKVLQTAPCLLNPLSQCSSLPHRRLSQVAAREQVFRWIWPPWVYSAWC